MATLGPLLNTGVIAGMVAAVATTALAAIAKAAGAGLEIDGVAIPVGAFTWWTVVGAVIGIGLARVLRTPRRFLVVTGVAFVVSLVPPIVLPDDTWTRLVLVTAHAIAAAIVVLALAGVLATAHPAKDQAEASA